MHLQVPAHRSAQDPGVLRCHCVARLGGFDQRKCHTVQLQRSAAHRASFARRWSALQRLHIAMSGLLRSKAGELWRRLVQKRELVGIDAHLNKYYMCAASLGCLSHAAMLWHVQLDRLICHCCGRAIVRALPACSAYPCTSHAANPASLMPTLRCPYCRCRVQLAQ